MRKPLSLTGSLLAAILAGGAIVRVDHDGYDYHVITKTGTLDLPEPKEGEKAPTPAFPYQVHKTNVYENNNEDFSVAISYNKNLRVVRSEFDAAVKQESTFKEKYPRTVLDKSVDNIAAAQE